MTKLTQQTCVPCTGNVPRLTEAERAAFQPQIPDWQVITAKAGERLQRVYRFQDFKTALAFTQQVGEIAEAAGHHPAILTEWGRVTVTWWTHTINGLHHNDLIMAAKTDEIAATAVSG